MTQPAYKRILLKLSGEVLMGGQQFGIDPEFVAELAKEVKAAKETGLEVCLVIGGADGIAPVLRARADFSISFGKMVWPHMLVRVMLAEQLYRAGQILAGTPYHRV